MTSTRTLHVPFDLENIDRLPNDLCEIRPLRHDKTKLLHRLAVLCDLSYGDMIGKTQLRFIAYKRFRAMYLLHMMNLSYPQIGRMLNKNHTTCLFGVNRCKASIAEHYNQMAAE